MTTNRNTPVTPVCCLCGGDIELDRSGKFWRTNNPDPAASNDQVCCDACNAFVVLPARYRAYQASLKNSNRS